MYGKAILLSVSKLCSKRKTVSFGAGKTEVTVTTLVFLRLPMGARLAVHPTMLQAPVILESRATGRP